MSDLKSVKLIYLKAVLFLVILVSSAGLIILLLPEWKVGILLLLVIWSSARLYYFMFYVIEKYVDPAYKFSGFFSFLKYIFSSTKKN
ncbi:MAG: hypothetical protein COA79_09225 [Planctomycetota bacterium]|nr:MAG: hypothetical protein COA79_09225 [Planctomycetota bacterium]